MKPGYKQTEVGVIPEDWEVHSIGQHYEFKNGLNKAKSFFGRGTPIINYMDAEIEVLETKLAKARQIKRGMIQALLTGRVRLQVSG